MKNKSKLNKIREQAKNKSCATQTKPIGEWIFLSSKEVDVKDLEQAAGDGYSCQVWIEAKVFEIEFEEGCIDFEYGECELEEIQSAYFVSFKTDIYEKAVRVMKTIAQNTGGYFVADNDKWEPRIG